MRVMASDAIMSGERMGPMEETGVTLAALALIEEGGRERLAARLASDIAVRLGSAIDADGQASLVVSGGSTPAPMFAELCRADIDWSRVSVTLADERWVPPSHADSNEALVRRTLLIERAAAARFVPLYRDAPSPESALAGVREAVAAMPRPFSVVVLGMGGDAHTASLFPDAPELARAMTDDDAVVAAMHPPSVTQARITLTRAALLDSGVRWLHLVGEDKREVLRRALAAASPRLPIARVLGVRPAEVTVYWSA